MMKRWISVGFFSLVAAVIAQLQLFSWLHPYESLQLQSGGVTTLSPSSRKLFDRASSHFDAEQRLAFGVGKSFF